MNTAEDIHQNKTLYLLGFTLLIASFIWAYYPILSKVVNVWIDNENYSHGFLILPIVAYLIWRKHSMALLSDSVLSGKFGLMIIVLSLLSVLIGLFSEFRSIANFSLISVIWGAFIFGLSFFFENIWELFLLIFMIPI